MAMSALPASANDDASVVVTATRTPERVGSLLADVSVLDRAALDRATGRTLVEVLSQLPGLQFSSNGGLGKLSSLFIRGLEARHTLLLVDGVRVGTATVGTPSLDNLPLESIERIEIVRGPMSALYGSDAVGGVVQIFTQRGQPGLQARARLAVGSAGYGQASAGLGWAAGAFDAAVQVQHTETRGFSATNSKAQFGGYNADRDGFKQDGGNLRLGWQIAPNLRADVLALESKGRSGYDDGPGTDAQAGVRTAVKSAQLSGRVTPGWQTKLSVSRSTDVYDTLSSASAFSTLGPIQTTQEQVSWENRIAAPVGSVLVLAERLLQQVSKAGSQYTVVERHINALALGLNGSAGSHLWQASVRRDDNSQFGGQTTGAAAYGFALSPDWRAGLSYGSSFVAPSFNQLYFPGFGNPNLLAEQGRQAEANLRWTTGAHSLRAALFQYRIRGYISSGPAPINIPRTRIEGLSLGYEGQWQTLRLAASLDHVDPRNATPANANFDKLLPRRASNAVKAAADLPLGDWTVGASLTAFSHRFDNAANTLRLGGYGTLDLRADWALSREWALGLRLNNVGDRVYETAYGYNQPRRETYLVLRYQPK